MTVPIETNIINFFKYFVTSLSTILNCQEKDKEVLSSILLVKYANPKEDQILTKEARKKIREKLKMSESSFNNSICRLKKVKALNQDNSINKRLIVSPKNNEYEVTYKFKIV